MFRNYRSLLTPLYLKQLITIVINFVLSIIFGFGGILFELTPAPFHRGFWRDDQSISYPHIGHDYVPIWAVLIILVILPILIFPFVQLVKRFFDKQSNWKKFTIALLQMFVYYLFALSVNQFFSAVLKVCIGRHRPDFISRCQPDYTEISNSTMWIDVSVCKGDPGVVQEGMKSWPSGHTSNMFVCMVFMALFLGNFRQYLKSHGRSLIIPFLQACLIMSGVLVGLSRISNYVHHWSDVLSGAIVGSCSGWFGFYNYAKEAEIMHQDDTVDSSGTDPKSDSDINV